MTSETLLGRNTTNPYVEQLSPVAASLSDFACGGEAKGLRSSSSNLKQSDVSNLGNNIPTDSTHSIRYPWMSFVYFQAYDQSHIGIVS
jgi:hypothetical protein